VRIRPILRRVGEQCAGRKRQLAQASARPTNGLPDLVVTAISWTGRELFAGTNVFKATVLNQGFGCLASGTIWAVGFLVDGTQVS